MQVEAVVVPVVLEKMLRVQVVLMVPEQVLVV